MQTRSQRKRFMAPLLFMALMMAQQSAHGQFNKYRSQTRFNPDKKAAADTTTPDVDTMTAEDAVKQLLSKVPRVVYRNNDTGEAIFASA